MKKKDLLNNGRNDFAYLIDNVDYTSEENVNYIFKFIKENVNSEYLMFDLYVSLHEDEFYQEDFAKFEKIISKESHYVQKIDNDCKHRRALFSLKSEKFTFDFFKNVIKYYSSIAIFYNLNDICYNLFFDNKEKLDNFSYESIILADYCVKIERNYLCFQSDIDIKMLCKNLRGKYRLLHD